MSDTRLRELEARFHETGLVEDEAEWLQERVRSGVLDQRMLDIAAYCGHPAAMLCGGETVADTGVVSWMESFPFIIEMSEVRLRILIIMAYNVLSMFEMYFSGETCASKAVLAGLKCLYDPNDQNKSDLQTFGSLAGDCSKIYIDFESNRFLPESLSAKGGSFAAEVISWLAVHTEDRSDQHEAITISYAVEEAANALGSAIAIANDQAISKVAIDEGKKQVKQAICDSLIPWALGYKDPLFDLVAELEATSTTD